MSASTASKYNSDTIQDKDFINVYKRLPEKSNATIRFFDRGDYYTLHANDAVFAAKEFFKTTTMIKTWVSADKKTELQTCNVNRNSFELLMRDLLLVKQYRVEIWRKNSKTNEWSCVNQGSPGNLMQFEDILYSSDDQNNIMSDPGIIAIQLSTEDMINKLHCGFVDKTSRIFYTCEISFKDNFADLESLLIHFGPKECLLFNNKTDICSRLMKIIEKHNVLITERKKTDFAYDLSCAELNKLVKTKGDINVGTLVELKNPLVVGCLNALIKYLDLVSDVNNDKKFKIKTHNLNNYLRLDCAAFKALNLLPERSDQQTFKSQSLYGLLNKCATNQGQRLLMQWIKQPLVDLNKLEERQNIVEILVNDTELRENLLENYLKKMPDFQKIEWKFIKQKATLQDCYKIYVALEILPHMYNTIINTDGKYAYLLQEIFANPLNSIMQDFVKYQEMVESTIDLKEIKNQFYLIKPSFDPDLQEIKDKLDEVTSKIEKLQDKAAKEIEIEAKSLKLESNPTEGYFFRISKKDESTIRNNKNFVIIGSKNDGIRFQTKKMQDYNEDFIRYTHEYEEQQKTLVDQVLRIAIGYLETLQQLNNLVSEIDVYIAFAKLVVSSQNEYIRPKLHKMEDGILMLKDARHPCVEVQDGVNYIPNDAEFKKDEKMFAIITGPNMGGKSTYIRSVGVVILMAQIGCFVPASVAEISIRDCILARMGAGDQQIKGVSTFMAEMIETSFILQTATSNSLVIIDELGRGTSTYDGFGLAWAISEYLVNKIKCFTLFATHFHELTELSEEIKTVYNLHVSAVTTDDNLTLLYKVNQGVCDRSFGIHVAQMVQFPENLIKDAKEKAKYFEDYCPDYKSDSVYDLQKKYKDKRETEELLNECFKKMKTMDEDSSMSDEEYVKKVHEMIKAEGAKVDNQYFNYLIGNAV